MLNKNILPTIFTSIVLANPVYADDIHTMKASRDVAQPPQHVPTTPSVNAVQVFVGKKVYLFLVDSPELKASFKKNSDGDNPVEKILPNINKRVKESGITSVMDISTKIGTYGVATAVNLSNGGVGFFTAGHVLGNKTPQDICITNRVVSGGGYDYIGKGVPIIKSPSSKFEGKIGYVQGPTPSIDGTIVHMPTTLRYKGGDSHITGRLPYFIGGLSGGPVISLDPISNKPGIISIFPGGVTSLDEKIKIGQFPKNETLHELIANASNKKGDFTECK